MKKTIYSVMFSFVTLVLAGQDCPTNELWNQFNESSLTTATSDESTYFNQDMPVILADDFILHEADRRVNTVCWLGGQIDIGEPGISDRGINTRNGENCDPGNIAVNITFYENSNFNVPGTIYNGASFIVTPTVENLPNNVCKFTATLPMVTEFSANTTYWMSIAGNVTGTCDYVLFGDPIGIPLERNSTGVRSDNQGNLPASYQFGSWTTLTSGVCPSWVLSNGLAPIPTLSQWGIIILGIGIIIFGLVYVRNSQKKLA